MAKTKDNNQIIETFLNKRVQLFLTLAGVAVALLNIWIAGTLAPIAQDIAVITQRVDAIEIGIVPRGEIEVQLVNIQDRLDRIENKIDNLNR